MKVLLNLKAKFNYYPKTYLKIILMIFYLFYLLIHTHMQFKKKWWQREDFDVFYQEIDMIQVS